MGADDPISLKDTAELLTSVTTEGMWELVPFPADRKKIDIGDYYGDYRKIRAKLGWKPKTALDKGLGQTLEFYRHHRSHYWN